jgi:hypothetical protein
MALNLDSTGLTMLLCGVSAFIFLMLFPAILELKKPKDAGPRTIIEEMLFQRFGLRVPMMDDSKEEVHMLDTATSGQIFEIISALPNLES